MVKQYYFRNKGLVLPRCFAKNISRQCFSLTTLIDPRSFSLDINLSSTFLLCQSYSNIRLDRPHVRPNQFASTRCYFWFRYFPWFFHPHFLQLPNHLMHTMVRVSWIGLKGKASFQLICFHCLSNHHGTSHSFRCPPGQLIQTWIGKQVMKIISAATSERVILTCFDQLDFIPSRGPVPLQAWIDTYEAVKSLGLIPDIPPSILTNGIVTYPIGTNTGPEGACSWTTNHCFADDIHDAPVNHIGVSFDVSSA